MSGKYIIDVLIGGSDTISRPSTDEEERDIDFMSGPQWSEDQIKAIKLRKEAE